VRTQDRLNVWVSILGPHVIHILTKCEVMFCVQWNKIMNLILSSSPNKTTSLQIIIHVIHVEKNCCVQRLGVNPLSLEFSSHKHLLSSHAAITKHFRFPVIFPIPREITFLGSSIFLINFDYFETTGFKLIYSPAYHKCHPPKMEAQ
jgi:hypothetical protein